jgi:hypothetical protein
VRKTTERRSHFTGFAKAKERWILFECVIGTGEQIKSFTQAASRIERLERVSQAFVLSGPSLLS